MTIIDYRRSALTIIRVSTTSTEELLKFLESHGQHHELVSAGRESGAPIILRNSQKGSQLKIPSSSYLVWDPDHLTVEIYATTSSLSAIGVNAKRISSMLQDAYPDSILHD